MLWTIDTLGTLQVLDGPDETATAIDNYGLFWAVKPGPKKVQGKSVPVYARMREAHHARTCFLARARVFHVCDSHDEPSCWNDVSYARAVMGTIDPFI